MCQNVLCVRFKNEELKVKLKKWIALGFMGLITIMPSFAISENTGFPNDDPYIDNATYRLYKKVTKNDRLIEALEAMKGGLSDYSRRAILGDNLTGRPVEIQFRNLGELNPAYQDFDALGWKNKNKLYIFVNQKHSDAPKEALAAVLTHEAIHQAELNSINEETYCWTLEAAAWTAFVEKNPELEKINHPLVDRETVIKKMFVKGGYTDKYIRKSVLSNAGYQTLPSRSPGFEDKDDI